MNTDNKKILSIDFSVSLKDHWTVGVQILYLVLFVIVRPNIIKKSLSVKVKVRA